MHLEKGAVRPEPAFLAAMAFQSAADAGIHSETRESHVNNVEVGFLTPAGLTPTKQDIETANAGLQFPDLGLRNPFLATLDQLERGLRHVQNATR